MIEVKFHVLDVHAGTTKEAINDFITKAEEEAENEAKKKPEGSDVWVCRQRIQFFDRARSRTHV